MLIECLVLALCICHTVCVLGVCMCAVATYFVRCSMLVRFALHTEKLGVPYVMLFDMQG